jgi:hypothetical protein
MSKGLEKLQAYRDESGRRIYAAGAVQQLGRDSFLVASESSADVYNVTLLDGSYSCQCKDFEIRGAYLKCKHICAVREMINQSEDLYVSCFY